MVSSVAKPRARESKALSEQVAGSAEKGLPSTSTHWHELLDHALVSSERLPNPKLQTDLANLA